MTDEFSWIKEAKNNFELEKILPLMKDGLYKEAVSDGLLFLTANIVGDGPLIRAAQGLHLETQQGRPVLDFSSMTVNCCLGQNDPWVKLSMLAYLDSSIPSFLSSRLRSAIYFNYPHRLTRLKIGGIENPKINHRQCNGSDVTELAVKAASVRANGRHKLISFVGGYHGQNLTAYYISDKQKQHRFLTDCPHVEFVSAPDHSDVDKEELSQHDQSVIEKIKELAPESFAIILEPIQMNNGVVCIAPAFLRELRKVCDEHDICMIFDEVQTAFGWLGSLTASEAYGVVPDIICLSKGVTAGYGPMALTVANEKYGELPYGSGEKTNGADIRAMVAANAVLDRLVGVEDTALLAHVEPRLADQLRYGLLKAVPEKARVFREHLDDLVQQNSLVIADMHQRGLIGGLRFQKTLGSDFVSKVVHTALDAGLFVRKSGEWLVIKPPITITQSEMTDGMMILSSVLMRLQNEQFNGNYKGLLRSTESRLSALAGADRTGEPQHGFSGTGSPGAQTDFALDARTETR